MSDNTYKLVKESFGADIWFLWDMKVIHHENFGSDTDVMVVSEGLSHFYYSSDIKISDYGAIIKGAACVNYPNKVCVIQNIINTRI